MNTRRLHVALVTFGFIACLLAHNWTAAIWAFTAGVWGWFALEPPHRTTDALKDDA